MARRYKAGESERKARALGFSSYNSYLASDHWQGFKRHCRLKIRPFRCKICKGFESGKMVLHHLTYEHLEAETIEDVALLCGWCHDHLHDVHRKSDIPLGDFAIAASKVLKIRAREMAQPKKKRKKRRKNRKSSAEIAAAKAKRKAERELLAMITARQEQERSMEEKRLRDKLRACRRASCDGLARADLMPPDTAYGNIRFTVGIRRRIER
jgi:hypothetical protein